MSQRNIAAFLCLGWMACGGGETPAAEPAAQTTAGSETPAPVAEPEAPAPEPAAPEPASGPSSLTVSATVNHAPVAAHVKLAGEDGATTAEGETGQKVTVPSGTYTLEVSVTDEKVLIDKPTHEQEVTLLPGGDTTQAIDFPWAKIKLNVRVNGNLDPKAVVRVLRKGAVVAEIKSAADYVTISPGRYGATVKARGAEIDIDELMFPQGATREMPVGVAIP